MIPLPTSNGMTADWRRIFHQEWSPPASLLEAASGDESLINDLIEVFSADSDYRIGQMRDALATLDFPRLRFQAHTVKGSARQLGAEAVAEACQEIETGSDLQDAPLIAARLTRVQELFEEVCGAMASYSNSQKLHQ
jgi:HPt (histidine-containing phosphotransfer) domain-containing protein